MSPRVPAVLSAHPGGEPFHAVGLQGFASEQIALQEATELTDGLIRLGYTNASMERAASAVLIPEADIQRRVSEMGAQISEDYAGGSLTVVGILKGSFIFIADLIRSINPSILVEVEFMTASSYGDATVSSGELRIEQDLSTPIAGKDVLLVEDIVDSGLTLGAVRDLLKSRNPRSLRIAALIDKESSRRQPVVLDYVGFHIPDLFVVGYGLDFAQHYRNLKEIRVLDAE
jgi:hypoxanthine phosphoribosyltransferase